MSQETIKIKGMHCKSCAELIETKLSSLEGIEEVKVNLAKDEAEVEFNPDKISLEMIKLEIGKLGYSIGDKGNEIKSEINKLGRYTGDKAENEQKKKGRGFLQGLTYGLIPHIGCIAFIIGSVLGVTALMKYFRPLLMNRYFFHALIGISLGLATLSSTFYLKKNGLLSWAGVKKKWKYLSVMYGSTMGINLLLFMLIFPLLANVSIGSSSITGAATATAGNENTDSLLKLKVDIPCPGHAPLISQGLKTIKGVTGIKFSFPDYFDVTYNSAETSKQEMLALDVFESYKAAVISDTAAEESIQEGKSIQEENNLPTGGSCCGGEGTCESGGGTCGSGGSCGCGS